MIYTIRLNDASSKNILDLGTPLAVFQSYIEASKECERRNNNGQGCHITTG